MTSNGDSGGSQSDENDATPDTQPPDTIAAPAVAVGTATGPAEEVEETEVPEDLSKVFRHSFRNLQPIPLRSTSDHPNLKCHFSLDIDSIAIVGKEPQAVIKKLSPTGAVLSVSMSTALSRFSTLKSSRFSVKSNHSSGDREGLKLKRNEANYNGSVRLSRFKNLKLADISVLNMKFRLCMYIVNERDFVKSNFFYDEYLYVICCALNAAMLHPDRFGQAYLHNHKAIKAFQQQVQGKFGSFFLKDSGHNKKRMGTITNMSGDMALRFFSFFTSALQNIASDPGNSWQVNYLEPQYLSIPHPDHFSSSSLQRQARHMFQHCMFVAETAGIQNVFPLKPEAIIPLGNHREIQKFCQRSLVSLYKQLFRLLKEKVNTGGAVPNLTVLFDVGLNVRPCEHNTSLFTSATAGKNYCNALLDLTLDAKFLGKYIAFT